MLHAAHRLDGLEKAKLCDLHVISTTTPEYYENLKNQFIRQYQPVELQSDVVSPNLAFKAESVDAKYAVMSVFAMAKGKVH
jgi:hypothetical protein